jgi:hypothetical protein
MHTYRVKLYTACDEEVIAENEQQAEQMAKKQLEEKLFKIDVNFVDIVQTKTIDAKTADKVVRI